MQNLLALHVEVRLSPTIRESLSGKYGITALPADRIILQRRGPVQFGSVILLAAYCYAIWAMNSGNPVVGNAVGGHRAVSSALWISIRLSRQYREGKHFQADDDEALAVKLSTHCSSRLFTSSLVLSWSCCSPMH